jgi:predicted Zn finger-like uncharacterized protein
MDVRCEKCGTEYELDDAKVTEAGVTVKCTSCGNLFKVRRRAGTNSPFVGPATSVGPLPTPPGGTARGFPAVGASPGAAPPRTRPMTMPPEGNTAVGGWMVRNPSGQVQRFRELTTLQQWIVERKVTRDCEISRTGESWRKLGDIAELMSFFQVVDLADANARAAAEAQVQRKNTQPFQPPGTTPAKVPTLNVAVVPPARPSAGTPVPAAGQLPARPPIGQPMTTLSGHDARPVPPRAPSQTLPPALPAPTPTQSGPMMSTGRQQTLGAEPAGPTGGLRGAPVLEPGWAGSTDAVRRTRAQLAEDAADDAPTTTHRPMTSPAFQQSPPTQLPEAFEPFDADHDVPAGSSRLPWLVAGLFIIFLGGGAAVYFMLAGKQKPAEAQVLVPDAAAVAVVADASTQPTTTPLGPDAAAAPVAATVDSAWQLFYADGDAAFEAAEKAFEQARTADPGADAAALAGLAFTNAAWAQALADDADASQTADARRADQLRAESRRRLERADKFVKDALVRDPKSQDAAVAAADVRRLQKAKLAEIDKLLAPALGHPEANYVKGMARWSAGQPAEAKKLLDVAAADFKGKKNREHVRARYRLALIALADKKYDDARAQLALVFVASPDHARGRALEARLASESGTAAAGPPDAGVAATVPPGGKPPGGSEPPVAGDAYDVLVDKGNKKAENGDCGGAMPLYERALDVRPGGVEALTGLGYCHLDRKEFARAQASFRAALGVSARYGDAIIGLAEAYRFQGQNDAALEQYQRYLAAQPNGPKAEMARRQVKNLTPSTPAPAPAPAPDTAPTPAPAPSAPPDKPAEPPATPAPSGQP